jgi:hypothetical protein
MTYKRSEWGIVAFLAFLGVLLIFLGWWVGRQNVAALQTLVASPVPLNLEPYQGLLLSVVNGFWGVSVSCLSVGIICLVFCFVQIGFTATQPVSMACPHCNKLVVPRVKLWSGHLYFSKKDANEAK